MSLKTVKKSINSTLLRFLFSNTFPSVLFQLLGLFLFPFYVDRLSDLDFTYYAQITTLISFTTIVCSAGMDTVYLRFMSDSKAQDSRFLTELLVIRFGLCVVVGIPLILVLNGNFFRLNLSFSGITVIILTFLVQSTLSLMLTGVRAGIRSRVLFMALMIQGAVYQVVLVISVFKGLSYIAYFIAAIISSLMAIITLRNEFNIVRIKTFKLLNGEMVFYGLKQMPHKVLSKIPELYLLSVILPSNYPGLLSFLGAVAIVINPISRLVDIFAKSWTPYRMDLYKKGNTSEIWRISNRIVISINICAIICICIVQLYFTYYVGIFYSIKWITSVILVVVIQAMYHVYNTGFEWVKRQEYLMAATFCGVILYIIAVNIFTSESFLLVSRAIPLYISAIIIRSIVNRETSVKIGFFGLLFTTGLFITLFVIYENV